MTFPILSPVLPGVLFFLVVFEKFFSQVYIDTQKLGLYNEPVTDRLVGSGLYTYLTKNIAYYIMN